MPLLFASGVCPKSVYPPADPLQFCTTGFAVALRQPGGARLHQGDRERPGEDRLLGDGDPALARRDRLRRWTCRRQIGMTPVDKEVIPPPTADYTPFATKLKDAGPNWVYSWAPWVTQVRTLRGAAQARLERRLHRLGASRSRSRAGAAQGRQVLRGQRERAVPGQPADPQGDRRRPPSRRARNIRRSTMTEGWIGGMAIEAALKAAGWPADAPRCAARWRT